MSVAHFRSIFITSVWVYIRLVYVMVEIIKSAIRNIKFGEIVMGFDRREFIKVLVATTAQICSGFSIANGNEVASKVAIEKAIKASFGAGFSLMAYTKSGAVTQAQIENDGNQYTVTSVNLFDWRIIKSSLSN